MATRALAVSPVRAFRDTLTQPAFAEQLRAALPSHIPLERFQRVATTAVQLNPDLLDPGKVDRRSLFGALIRAATDGLLPDGREGVIVPYRGKAQWQPMVAGIQKKVRQSGEISNWDAFPVFEKDEFQRLLGDDMRLYHAPYEGGPPGDVVGAYSIVTFKDGTKSKDYLPRWRIDKALAQNPRGADSLMRREFFDEAAVKTVMRHHAKRLPQSTDIEALFSDGDAAPEPGRQPAASGPETVMAPPRSLSRLDALEGSLGLSPEPEPEPVDDTQAVDEAAAFSAVLLEEALLAVDDATDVDTVNRTVVAFMSRLTPADKSTLTSAALAKIDELEPPDNDETPY